METLAPERAMSRRSERGDVSSERSDAESAEELMACIDNTSGEGRGLPILGGSEVGIGETDIGSVGTGPAGATIIDAVKVRTAHVGTRQIDLAESCVRRPHSL